MSDLSDALARLVVSGCERWGWRIDELWWQYAAGSADESVLHGRLTSVAERSVRSATLVVGPVPDLARRARRAKAQVSVLRLPGRWRGAIVRGEAEPTVASRLLARPPVSQVVWLLAQAAALWSAGGGCVVPEGLMVTRRGLRVHPVGLVSPATTCEGLLSWCGDVARGYDELAGLAQAIAGGTQPREVRRMVSHLLAVAGPEPLTAMDPTAWFEPRLATLDV